LLTQGMVTLGGSAMSKSRGNVVDPGTIIARYGADTARLFILFAAPPEKQLEWNDGAVEGQWRFLNRVFRMTRQYLENKGKAPAPEANRKALLRKTHWAIQKVTADLGEHIQINTAIAAVMELINLLYQYPAVGDGVSGDAIRTAVQLLAPMAPHLMEELWQELGGGGLVMESSWPVFDLQYLVADVVEIPVQINGKLRGLLKLPAASTNDVLEREALADGKVQAALQGKSILKVVVIPGKLVNIVSK